MPTDLKLPKDTTTCTYWVAGTPDRCGRPSVVTFHELGACRAHVHNAGLCEQHKASIHAVWTCTHPSHGMD